MGRRELHERERTAGVMGHGHRTEHYINSVVPKLPFTKRLSSQFWGSCYGLESLFVGKIIQSSFRVPQLTNTP